MPRAGGIGCLGLLIIMAIAYFTGTNPLELLQQVGTDTSGPVQQQPSVPAADDTGGEFVKHVLGSTEDAWAQVFASDGLQYRPPTLVLFEDMVQSACGFGSAAVGPFYCPQDGKVYIDLSFFHQLSRQFGASGDFARAYVIAHEVGHHVQNLLGILDEIERARSRASERQSNQLSVLMELQADCLAGVWGHYANQRERILDPGDIEDGLNAAQSIGDDLIQKRNQGYVNRDSFTHGSSQQRAYWLRRGLESGRVDACNVMESGDIF